MGFSYPWPEKNGFWEYSNPEIKFSVNTTPKEQTLAQNCIVWAAQLGLGIWAVDE
jgi:hypothetical protein